MDTRKKIKIICQWDPPLAAQAVFNIMSKDGKGGWDKIRFVYTDDEEPDYYVIINYPGHISQEYFNKIFREPKKILFFHLEPSYFYKQLGFFADPPKDFFGKLCTHKYERNLFQSTLDKSYSYLKETDLSLQKVTSERGSDLSMLISSLYTWPGHKLRVDFVHFLEKNHPEFKFDLYGKTNDQNFKTYIGVIPVYKKDAGVIPYKYTFNCENSNEYNYATEKIVDAILSETLCFYWGCHNLEDYLEPESFIRLPLEEDFEKSFQIMREAIENNEWEKRLPSIKRMKHKILDELQFFPHIEKIIKSIEN